MPIGFPFGSGESGVYGPMELFSVSNFPSWKTSTDNRTSLANSGKIIGSRDGSSDEICAVISSGANQAFLFNIQSGRVLAPKLALPLALDYTAVHPVRTNNGAYLLAGAYGPPHKLIRIAPGGLSVSVIDAINSGGGSQFTRLFHIPESNTLLWFYGSDTDPFWNLMRSTDDGLNWTYSSFGANQWGSITSTPYAIWEYNGETFGIRAINNTIDGELMLSSDGGLTWSLVGPTNNQTAFNSYAFIPELGVFVSVTSGPNKIRRSQPGDFENYDTIPFDWDIANLPGSAWNAGGLIYAKNQGKLVAFLNNVIPIISSDFGQTFGTAALIGINNPYQLNSSGFVSTVQSIYTRSGIVVYAPGNAHSPIQNII